MQPRPCRAPRNRSALAAATLAVLTLPLLGVSPAHGQTRVSIDTSVRHQTMEGFGATTISLKYGTNDNVPAALRPLAIAALYRDVRLNMGNLDVEPYESSPTDVYAVANDDDDPFTTNPAGFNWLQSDNMYELVVMPGSAFGFDNYYLGPVVRTGFALAFARAYRGSDYERYLDEIAEHVLAVVAHWRDAYGITPRYLAPFNEPTSGNGEVPGANGAELVDIVRRIGMRLRAAGFATLLVVPSEEREDISLQNARLILDDPEASTYVGAISYHPYPYGSTYASVPNILSTSGAGTPDPEMVSIRNQLRDLAAAHGVKVFMTEVSHSELPFDDFRNVRGRAIHIHDELTYADAAAFFGMLAMWDTVSHAQHFMGRADPGFWNETDTIVLIDDEAGTVTISPMGRAIGHYARFLTRGAVRVDATSEDPLLLATAFEDAAAGRVVVVAINNASAPRDLVITVAGTALGGTVEGELSTAAAPWVPVSGATVDVTTGTLRFAMPAESIVTLSATTATGPAPDAGGVPPGSDGGPGGGTDAGGGTTTADGGIARPAEGGCGCRVTGTPNRRWLALAGLSALAMVLAARRTRTRNRLPASLVGPPRWDVDRVTRGGRRVRAGQWGRAGGPPGATTHSNGRRAILRGAPTPQPGPDRPRGAVAGFGERFLAGRFALRHLPLPDVLGCAIRLTRTPELAPAVHGDDQDLRLATIRRTWRPIRRARRARAARQRSGRPMS